MKATGLLLVFLSGSVQADAIDNLVNDSQSVLNSLDYGIRAVGGAITVVPDGQIIPTGMMTDGQISEAQVNAYNEALSIVAGSTFYSAEMFLNESL